MQIGIFHPFSCKAGSVFNRQKKDDTIFPDCDLVLQGTAVHPPHLSHFPIIHPTIQQTLRITRFGLVQLIIRKPLGQMVGGARGGGWFGGDGTVFPFSLLRQQC